MDPWMSKQTTISWVYIHDLECDGEIWVLIRIDRSTSLIMAFLEPSIAFTIKALGFNETPSRVNFINVLFGMKFKEGHVSTNTRDMIMSKHFIEICGALFCDPPSAGCSPSLKPRKFPAVILTTTPSNW